MEKNHGEQPRFDFDAPPEHLILKGRIIPCPECGDARGTNPSCALCKEYNPSLKKTLRAVEGMPDEPVGSDKPQKSLAESEVWQATKRKLGADNDDSNKKTA